MTFQIAWSTATPGEKHVSFSGYRTACGQSVSESKPAYDLKPEDVTCWLCGGALMFDVETARKAALEFVRNAPAAQKWETSSQYEFAGLVADRVVGIAWYVKREHGSWNSNHVFSEFMAQGGYMADNSSMTRLIGSTALAVLEVLTETD